MAAVPDPKKRDYNEAIYHRRPGGLSFFKTGLVVVVLALIVGYLAFAKQLPWSSPGYELNATFTNASTLRVDSPVRIAGVNVGKVTGVERQGEGAKVTFTVEEDGRPIHDDARVTIRPRLFLGGNFFLDLRPGSPGSPDLDSGGSIPSTQTAVAVELDQILTALQRPDRANLRRLLDGYGSALYDEPTPAQDRGQDPEVRGLSAAEALNGAFEYGGRAGKGSSLVNEALLGEQAGDLRKLIRASSVTFGKLASRQTELRELITNFAITTGAFAAESASLEQTLAELAPTAEQAQGQLVSINASFPPLRAFARALTPSVEELPATIEAGNPWLIQASRLLTRDELAGVAANLRASTPDLSRGTANLTTLLTGLGLTSRCFSRVLEPTGNVVIDDDFATGQSNFNEFLYGLVSQAGEGAVFDGNGPFLRVQPGAGSQAVSTPIPGGLTNDDVLYGNSIAPPLGTQPPKPSKKPPVRTDFACHRNDVPDLNGPRAQVGPPNPAPISNFPFAP